MQKRQIFDSRLLEITIQRLCQQLIENHEQFENTVILGLQPRGKYLADRLKSVLETYLGKEIKLGYLDITFFRDDFRRRETPLKANATSVPFLIEDKSVVLVDDVLFTGRSVQAALSAMNAYGRPQKVELLTLVNRRYSRDLPIEPRYVGKEVNTLASERVLVEWKVQGAKEDNVWLVNKEQ
ncbi:bifunctional pyr operon transcriptional regulator/uracil phosphoribosyltransferase PyrR [Xanthovirga aplysinae]|uniref:bifunctional pyr operon transcriptional regulator/uracil phosphoribosyltransferase PyrR n=1 Tax=Xanthovirga aplysinae TaxID=2529853 RepID=UPI0012BC4C51|nr:bifunctional pyr operon transcriptional regulator/uracil phosphoribosyltransferase PyrR [Xanthovirga aplysinae]